VGRFPVLGQGGRNCFGKQTPKKGRFFHLIAGFGIVFGGVLGMGGVRGAKETKGARGAKRARGGATLSSNVALQC